MYYNHCKTQRDSDAPTTVSGGTGYAQRIDVPAFEGYQKHHSLTRWAAIFSVTLAIAAVANAHC